MPAYRLRQIGLTITLEDYEQRLPAVTAADLIQIAEDLKVS